MQFISSYEFTKQEEEEETMNKLTFQHNKRENEFENLMFVGFERNIYSKYIGRIKLIESDKTDKDLIFTQEETNIFKKSSVKKLMKIADPNEKCFIQAKQKIENILRQQYQDCSRVYEIFNQLNPIITNHLSLKINKFLRQESKSKLDYFKLVSEIKCFRKL